MINQWMPADFIYSDEEIANMTAESIRRTLELRDVERTPTDIDKQQAITNAFSSYIKQAVETRKREIQNEEVTS